MRQTVLAGLNVRTNFSKPETFVLPLRELVKEGTIPQSVLDSRVRDVLRVKFRRGLFAPHYRSLAEADKVALAPEHFELSKRASRVAIVLLKNDRNFLPLDAAKFKTIANFVKSTGQLPLSFPAKPGANTEDSKHGVSGYLWPFGHGLSYTTFAYQNLRLEPKVIRPDGKFNAVFEITNTGKREGVEIPQLYFRQKLRSLTVYNQQLRGFDRINLTPGETRTVTIPIDAAESLWMLDKDMDKVVEQGDFEIQIGASSKDIKLKQTLTVVK